MRYREISEAPIEDLTHVGDWEKSSSFRHAQDRKLLTNPKALRKITAQWEKTPVNFNVYLVNNKDGTKHGEVGEVSKKWMEENLPTTAPYIEIKPDAVNLLFMNNTGDERVPMTGWIMAHRFGHVVARHNFGQGTKPRGNSMGMERQFADFEDAREALNRTMMSILNDGYGYKLRQTNGGWFGPEGNVLVAFYEQIGTMRSARTGAIRNEFEFTLELLAQYMLTGRMKFNPIPKTFSKGRSVHASFKGPEDDMDYYNGMLDDLADGTLNYMFDNLLQACVGKILVM